MSKRETTDIERAFARYDAASPANVVASAWLEGASENHLAEAFQLVSASHPYLGLRLSDDAAFWTESTGAPRFALTDKPALDGELHHPFTSTDAPVRAVLVRGSPAQLLVTASHIVADGMSTIQLLRQVLETASDLHRGKRPVLTKHPLNRPSSSVMPVSEPPRLAMSEPGPQGFALTAEPPPVPSAAPTEKAKSSSLSLWSVDAQGSRAVAETANRLGVTVNALLTAALALTLRDCVGDGWMQISSSLDLRRRLPDTVRPDDLGMWAGRAVVWASLRHETSLEGFARAFAAMLRNYTEHHAFHGIRAFLAPPAALPALPHAKITNMGNFDRHGFRSDYGFRLENALCLTPLHRGWQGERGLGLIPSSFAGKMHLALMFGSPAWTQMAIDEAASRFHRYLLPDRPASISLFSTR